MFDRLAKYFFASRIIETTKTEMRATLRKTMISPGPRMTADFTAKGGRITIQGKLLVSCFIVKFKPYEGGYVAITGEILCSRKTILFFENIRMLEKLKMAQSE